MVHITFVSRDVYVSLCLEKFGHKSLFVLDVLKKDENRDVWTSITGTPSPKKYIVMDLPKEGMESWNSLIGLFDISY